ncbi:MAG: TrkH family potassium uptake protein [Deltaproteobacteria bacterium]|nr:TrkH family potassium uptake protein [Deltaproteobacteria bacterium]
MHPRLITAALGAILAVLGLCMSTSIPWSLHFGDQAHDELLLISAACAILGSLAALGFWKAGAEYSVKDGFVVVTLGWVLAGLLGGMPYYICGVAPSFVDAVFESVSGFTTTGSSVMADVESLPRSLLFWRSLTHWLGGMGIIVLSVAILPILGVGGMAMLKAEIPSPTVDRLRPTVAATAKTLWKVYLFLTVLQTLLLWLAGMDLFDSICHTFATLATGGFSTKNLSVGHYNSPVIYCIIIVFMLLAGLNFTLHYEAATGKPGVYWNTTECRTYLLLFVVCSLFIAWNVYGEIYANLSEAFIGSAFQVASIMTTTGFVTNDWEKWPWVCQWLLLCLMFMGGCAGSTGGGIKCMRLIVLTKAVFRELRLLSHPRAVISLKVDRKVIPGPIVSGILAFIGLFVGVWSASVLALIAMQIDVITAVGAVTANLSNVGPGLNRVGATDTYEWMSEPVKWVLIFDMLVGRLELYTVFVLLTPSFWRR